MSDDLITLSMDELKEIIDNRVRQYLLDHLGLVQTSVSSGHLPNLVNVSIILDRDKYGNPLKYVTNYIPAS
jgi:hypothetical protein